MTPSPRCTIDGSVLDPEAQSRIGAAMKRGLQTRDAEMALGRMLANFVARYG